MKPPGVMCEPGLGQGRTLPGSFSGKKCSRPGPPRFASPPLGPARSLVLVKPSRVLCSEGPTRRPTAWPHVHTHVYTLRYLALTVRHPSATMVPWGWGREGSGGQEGPCSPTLPPQGCTECLSASDPAPADRSPAAQRVSGHLVLTLYPDLLQLRHLRNGLLQVLHKLPHLVQAQGAEVQHLLLLGARERGHQCDAMRVIWKPDPRPHRP